MSGVTATSALPQLDPRRSLADAVHHALRDAITDGKLQPGARLMEVAIANHFDVSPTPVREAIRRLEREGLVETNPHRGASVALISAADMVNLYEIHEVLEAFAVRQAAALPDRDIDHLDMLLDTIDPIVEDPDQTVFNRLDLRFHRAVNDMSGNPQLAQLIEGIHRRIQAARVRYDIELPDPPRHSQVQHRAILGAVKTGDVDLAEQLTRDHIRSVRSSVNRILGAAAPMAGKEGREPDPLR